MYKPKYICKSFSKSKLKQTEIPTINVKKEVQIVESPTTKVEDGYGHFAPADESDAPKIKQSEVIHTSRLQEALQYIFVVVKKTLSYITLGCL